MKVFVYRNLHQRCWSVKALEGPNKGRVILHASKVLLRDATFKVSEAGRQRVIREGRKNVHAGVVGELDGADTIETFHGAFEYLWIASDKRYDKLSRAFGRSVTYNPHVYCDFRQINYGGINEPIHAADLTVLTVQMGKPAVFALDIKDIPASATEEIG